jgi:hypothetical protein
MTLGHDGRHGNPLDRLIKGADGLDVRVFPHRT